MACFLTTLFGMAFVLAALEVGLRLTPVATAPDVSRRPPALGNWP